jgi:hypothetical protein
LGAWISALITGFTGLIFLFIPNPIQVISQYTASLCVGAEYVIAISIVHVVGATLVLLLLDHVTDGRADDCVMHDD